ncbi:MAG: hypothetical protein JRE16_01755, partial [Deltaproteobacteria bacterium]|nr:hypothetical protein [Deltaproteobacteria bacterium]
FTIIREIFNPGWSYGQVRKKTELLEVQNSIYEVHLSLISLGLGLEHDDEPEH